MENIIRMRTNHIQKNPEFNISDGPIVNLQVLSSWIKNDGTILELGTKRSTNNPTHHKSFFNSNVKYIMTDYQSGIDVDVVCDLHKTKDTFQDKSFDLIVSCSTFEHLKYPHIVAHNLMKMLKIGGRIFIQTHQSFPLHGYKYDYFRFSREALWALFPNTMGMKKISSYFEYPCVLLPHDQTIPWNPNAESYLNVCFVAEKISETPDTFVPDFENT